MITNKEFTETISKFDESEKRGSFYDMAVELMNSGFEIEAYCLILATWNFAAFRYVVKNFDIIGFKETVGELNPYFDKMKNDNFKTINFDKYEEDIKETFLFVILSKMSMDVIQSRLVVQQKQPLIFGLDPQSAKKMNH